MFYNWPILSLGWYILRDLTIALRLCEVNIVPTLFLRRLTSWILLILLHTACLKYLLLFQILFLLIYAYQIVVSFRVRKGLSFEFLIVWLHLYSLAVNVVIKLRLWFFDLHVFIWLLSRIAWMLLLRCFLLILIIHLSIWVLYRFFHFSFFLLSCIGKWHA